jgi:hypothetical protein
MNFFSQLPILSPHKISAFPPESPCVYTQVVCRLLLLSPHPASLCHIPVSVGTFYWRRSGLYETLLLLRDSHQCGVPNSTQGCVCPSHAIGRNSRKLNKIVNCWRQTDHQNPLPTTGSTSLTLPRITLFRSLWFSQGRGWGLRPAEIQRSVTAWSISDVSNERTAFIFSDLDRLSRDAA